MIRLVYVTMYTEEEARELPREKVLETVGMVDGKTVVSAPQCTKCGSPCLMVDLGDPYLQCSSCGVIAKMGVYSRPFFKGSKKEGV